MTFAMRQEEQHVSREWKDIVAIWSVCFCFCLLVVWIALCHVGSKFPSQAFKPMPPALEAQSLSHWSTRELPLLAFGISRKMSGSLSPQKQILKQTCECICVFVGGGISGSTQGRRQKREKNKKSYSSEYVTTISTWAYLPEEPLEEPWTHLRITAGREEEAAASISQSPVLRLEGSSCDIHSLFLAAQTPACDKRILSKINSTVSRTSLQVSQMGQENGGVSPSLHSWSLHGESVLEQDLSWSIWAAITKTPQTGWLINSKHFFS